MNNERAADQEQEERHDRGPRQLGEMPLFSLWHHAALVAMQARAPRAYSRGMEQNAVDDQELMFPSWTRLVAAAKAKRLKVGWLDGHGVRVKDLLGPDPGNWHRDWEFFGGMDLSGKHRKGNVIVTIAAEKVRQGGDRRWFPVEVSTGEWTQPQMIDEITGANRRWRWTGAYVEDNGLQEQLLEWGKVTPSAAEWSRKQGLVEGFTTTSRKWDDYLGLPGIEIDLAREVVSVPAGEWEQHGEDCTCGWCVLDAEMAGFTKSGPGAAARGTASQGDTVMGLYFAIERAKRGEQRAERGAADVRAR